MNIELPKDAEGRKIPLDTEVLYQEDGKEYTVVKWEWGFCPLNTVPEWGVYLVHNGSQEYCTPECLYLTPRDSWEKLLDDLDNAVKGGDNAECLYMHREDIEVGEQCSGCRLYNADDVFSDCSCLAYADIADRIRKLRGEDE